MLKRFWRLAGLTGLLLTSLQVTAAAEEVTQTLQRQTQGDERCHLGGDGGRLGALPGRQGRVYREDGAISTKAQMRPCGPKRQTSSSCGKAPLPQDFPARLRGPRHRVPRAA